MKQEQIDRINELYHKSQAVGLTDAEKEVEKDGSVTDLGKKYGNVGKTES